jgi:NitT/TauT family transport system substrate-binding protein/putative hydroxymethylpyrimidine transport system substrate-binding protein
MRWIAASLAAVLALAMALAAAGCGGDGAEPDAPDGRAPASATAGEPLDLVLDFQPNAVHSGIYLAQQEGLFEDAGVDLVIQAPGASTDAPKLLRAGRADLAIMDIHDLAIAREQGVDLLGVGAIVQQPLAAVIAGDRREIRKPADLEGKTIGVTGLPSDTAVLNAVLALGGLGPEDVDTVTIGFDAVPQLLAGRVDAATAFWNAEGVTLADRIPTREFRVADIGEVPTYPELVLVTTPEKL